MTGKLSNFMPRHVVIFFNMKNSFPYIKTKNRKYKKFIAKTRKFNWSGYFFIHLRVEGWMDRWHMIDGKICQELLLKVILLKDWYN